MYTIYIHPHIYTYIYTHTHTYIHIYIYIYIYIYVHTHAHVHTCIRSFTHMHMNMPCTTHTHTDNATWLLSSCVYMIQYVYFMIMYMLLSIYDMLSSTHYNASYGPGIRAGVYRYGITPYIDPTGFIYMLRYPQSRTLISHGAATPCGYMLGHAMDDMATLVLHDRGGVCAGVCVSEARGRWWEYDQPVEPTAHLPVYIYIHYTTYVYVSCVCLCGMCTRNTVGRHTDVSRQYIVPRTPWL